MTKMEDVYRGDPGFGDPSILSGADPNPQTRVSEAGITTNDPETGEFTPSSNEFFYIDENGKKQDAGLFGDIPDTVHPTSIDAAKAAGLTDEQIRSLFGSDE